MTLGDYVLAAWMIFVTGGLAALLWSRLNRIESRMDSEFRQLHSDITQVALAIGAVRPGPRPLDG